MKPSETKQNIINIIKQYSIESGIPLQFLEKDVYAMKILALLSKINYPNIKILFTGGTCLSKAYGKIKRFSEDLDFCVATSIPFSRKEKSNFRKYIITEINKNDNFTVLEPITATDKSSFFSFEVEYNKRFDTSSNLRKNIKIEFKFENPILPIHNCKIQSFIHKYINDEATNLDCINIIEIVANKFSALLWRTYIKDRTKPLYSKENDPTIIRHLYDIAILKKEIKTSEFTEILKAIYAKDNGRGGIKNKYTLSEFAKVIYDKLNNDALFKKEYLDFVDTMCYSQEKLSFEDALVNFKNIIEYITT